MALTSAQAKMFLGISAAIIVIGFVFSAVAGMAGRAPENKMIEKTIEQSMRKNADVKTGNDGAVKVTTDRGTVSMGHEVPADWPKDAPVYPGATVQFSATANPADGKQSHALMMMTPDSGAAVTDFFAKELKAQGWALAATMQGGATAIMSAMKDDRTLSVAVTESAGQTNISLGIETKTK